jgi:hypothetical protein
MNVAPDIFRFRTAPTTSAPESVDVAAGIIRGVSAMQAVEALGHGMAIDATTLEQVAKLGNAATGKGIKVRFGHPGACDNALGTMVGHATNFRVSGDKVLNDITLSDAASVSPKGNLRAYLLKLAQENPRDFGMSVVIKAQRAWKLDGGGEVITQKERPANAIGDLPFARVQELKAVDFVDEPAANRDGLFSDADLVAAFSGTSNATADDAFAALDDLRDRLGLSVLDVARFAQRYLTARRTEPTPEPTPATGTTMKLSAALILALASEFPQFLPVINAAATAGDDEAQVRSKIGDARLAALTSEVTELKAKQIADATALATEKADHAKTTAKLAALQKLGGAAAIDPGGAPADTALAGLTGDALYRAEFSRSPDLQEKFSLGGVESYVAFRAAESRRAAVGK